MILHILCRKFMGARKACKNATKIHAVTRVSPYVLDLVTKRENLRKELEVIKPLEKDSPDVYYDLFEEIHEAISVVSLKIDSANCEDPLDELCRDNPWADECKEFDV